MKFFYILLKDVTVFFRDIRNFMFLILMPVVIVILLGLVFLSNEPSNVPIVVCDLAMDDTSGRIFSAVENSTVFSTIRLYSDCDKAISNGIKNSAIRGGIIIPKGLTENIRNGSSQELETIVDNTKPVWPYVAVYFSRISDYMSDAVTEEIINSTWSKLRNVSDDMEGLSGDLNDYKKKLENITKDLDNVVSSIRYLEGNLSSIDTSEVENKLNASSEILRNSTFYFDSINSNLAESEGIMTQVTQVAALVDDAEKSQAILQNISLLRANFEVLKLSLSGIQSSLAGTETNIRESQKKVKAIQASNISKDLGGIRSELEMTSGFFNQTYLSVSVLSEKVDESRDLFKKLVEKDPSFVASPVEFRVNAFYKGQRFIDFLFPSIMMLIVMMISILLPAVSFVRDRNSGLLERVMLSPVKLEFLIAEKVVSYFLISLLQVPLILFIGTYFFDIQISMSNLLPIFVVSSASIIMFIFFGLAIASFSKSESTAIMASMLFIIPMIFLSGVFIAIEIMPGFIRPIAESLPISVPVRLLETLILQNSGINLIVLGLQLFLYIIFYTIVSWALIRKWLK
ncbi:MAG: ABC transporter permease [Candidatus Aenigmarchaeota archaeon]|nr:ABC transporter permease [Candidatus Aenigmarchaeota archaeon]